MKTWMTGLALLAALLVQGCAMQTTGTDPKSPAPTPDFGNKAYGY